jgi:D-amino-acid oxidase
MTRAIVVGAGVVGLSCAVRLLESGHRVDVLARDLPLETTSAVAAAIWYPFRALPQDRVTAWSGATYAEFVGLAGEQGTGVRMLTGTEVFRERQPDPWWRSAVPSLDRETALRRASATAGRSSPRSWRCRSTCAGWSAGSRSSAARSPV